MIPSDFGELADYWMTCHHDGEVLKLNDRTQRFDCTRGHSYSANVSDDFEISITEVYFKGEPHMLDMTRPFRDQLIVHEAASGILYVDEAVSGWHIDVARAGHVFH